MKGRREKGMGTIFNMKDFRNLNVNFYLQNSPIAHTRDWLGRSP